MPSTELLISALLLSFYSPRVSFISFAWWFGVWCLIEKYTLLCLFGTHLKIHFQMELEEEAITSTPRVWPLNIYICVCVYIYSLTELEIKGVLFFFFSPSVTGCI